VSLKESKLFGKTRRQGKTSRRGKKEKKGGKDESRKRCGLSNGKKKQAECIKQACNARLSQKKDGGGKIEGDRDHGWPKKKQHKRYATRVLLVCPLLCVVRKLVVLVIVGSIRFSYMK